MAEISYGRVLTQLAEERGDQVALVCEHVELSWRQLEQRANQMARVYAELRVGAGDFVSLILENGTDLAIHCFAAWKCGAVPNPISVAIPRRERDRVLGHAAPALIVGGEPLAAIPHIDASFEPGDDVALEPLADATSPQWRALASGGSTGTPKLIVMRAPALYDRSRTRSPVAPTGRVLVPGPLCHAAPFNSFTQAILSGFGAVLMKRFDARLCLELIERHRIEHVLFVPTMLHRIWRLPDRDRLSFDLSSLRFVLTGGAPCPQWLMRAWIEWLGADVMHEAYGPSERIGGTFITGGEWLERPGSVGRPSGGTGLRILDPQTLDDVATGEVGEVFMMPAGGSGSTFRYVGAERRTTPDGWESVGDMGYVDSAGYLYLTDRRTDMILCRGRNIYPAQIEAALDEHPGVLSSAVIGLPDDDRGQAVHAIVQTAVGVSDDILRAHLGERVARYAVPHTFEFVDCPLRDDAGKARRFALRQERLGQRRA